MPKKQDVGPCFFYAFQSNLTSCKNSLRFHQ
ncbi:hypothetical protein Asd1617_03138 [Shigella dysenteriae 1617]|uniref:Uncharacterized protein n=1 Tax=Shigella dysenteriae 1617 TaxID=754093 RepID=A0A0A6ZVN0_SHIDY|nr:hypothetical protein Asd1617_03138 [Shigella dysenteriae 1617]